MSRIAAITLVTLAIIFEPSHGEVSNCTRELINTYKGPTACCQGQHYAIGGDENLVESCNVDPKDDNLSLEESIWLAYECHVKQSLGATAFTRNSVVNLLSKLPNTKQDKLLKALPPEDVSDPEDRTKESIKKIKSYTYWTTYYVALRKICAKPDEPVLTSKNVTPRPKPGRLELEPVEKCKNGKVPAFLMQPSVNSEQLFSQCNEALNTAMLLNNRTIYRRSFSLFCERIFTENMNMEDMATPDFDFQIIINSLFPKFWSKSIKALGNQVILNRLKHYFDLEEGDLKQIIDVMRPKTQMELKDDVTDDDPISDDILLNAAIAANIWSIAWTQVPERVGKTGTEASLNTHYT